MLLSLSLKDCRLFTLNSKKSFVKIFFKNFRYLPLKSLKNLNIFFLKIWLLSNPGNPSYSAASLQTMFSIITIINIIVISCFILSFVDAAEGTCVAVEFVKKPGEKKSGKSIL